MQTALVTWRMLECSVNQWSFTLVITQITATIMTVIGDNDNGQKEDKLQTHASNYEGKEVMKTKVNNICSAGGLALCSMGQ